MRNPWIMRGALLAMACLPITARAADEDPAMAAQRAAILTPPSPMTPRINGPRIYGERTSKPFFYHIPTTGQRPIAFKADRLPAGLTLDAASGTITGRSSAAGSHPVKITATNALGTDSVTLNIVIGDTIALTPPLGWNSWNRFAGRVTAQDVKGSADAMANAGLIDHGWTYINIDDTWEGQRDANGVLATNQKFPDMKGLADYIHGKGLKFGIYSSPGPTTCARYVASYQHEMQDVELYAQWGVDYVKYDWCSYGSIAPLRREALYAEQLDPADAAKLKDLIAERAKLPGGALGARRGGPPAGGPGARGPATQPGRAGGPVTQPGGGRRGRGPVGTPEEQAKVAELTAQINALHNKVDPAQQKAIELKILQEPYELFHQCLEKADRDILYSLCQYGDGAVWTWGADVGGNCWRTTGDIRAQWSSIASLGFDRQIGHEAYARPGHWNDPDMLEVGNGNLTPDEMYTHFSLWCILSSPLLIGCDMSRMDPLVISIFSNDEVLAVSQDSLGKQGARASKNGDLEVWSKPLADGSLAVGLFNRGSEEAKVSAKFADLKLTGKQKIRDLWRQKDLGNFDDAYEATVHPHGVILVRLSAA